MTKVVIVDYQIGNVFSVARAVEAIGRQPILTGGAKLIAEADRVILPGVGAFGRALDRLRQLELADAVRRFIDTGKPLLGICVGAQALLTTGTEFGQHDGLDIIEGTVDRMPDSNIEGAPLILPHIAWSPVGPAADADGLKRWDASPFSALPNNGRDMYFVHSYALRPSDPTRVVASVKFGGYDIAAAIGVDNVLGVQFHPERSGPSGLAFLEHWANSN